MSFFTGSTGAVYKTTECASMSAPADSIGFKFLLPSSFLFTVEVFQETLPFDVTESF
jgi:hypothetical protein